MGPLASVSEMAMCTAVCNRSLHSGKPSGGLSQLLSLERGPGLATEALEAN